VVKFSDLKYWTTKNYGGLIVRYNTKFKRFGWDKLKAIADKTIKSLKNDEEMDGSLNLHIATGSVLSLAYVAFSLKDSNGKTNICIETRSGFETAIGAKLSNIIENTLKDGQHKHGEIK